MCTLAAPPVSRLSAKCECCNCGLLSCQPAAASTDWEEEGHCQHVRTLDDVHMQGMVAPHMADPNWGAHASAMLNGTIFRQPPGGGHDDKCVPSAARTSSRAQHSKVSLLPSGCLVPRGIGVADTAADRVGCIYTSKPSAILDQNASMQIDHVCVCAMIVHKTCNSRCLKATSQVTRWQGMLCHQHHQMPESLSQRLTLLVDGGRTGARHCRNAALGLTHVLGTRAHPPIHPTRYTPGEASWDAGKKALYDFIVRSFLA